MKKLLLFAVIAIVAFSLSIVGCSKDKEQDPIQWKFEVTAKTEKIETGLGTNDIVPLEFLINKEYESGATITYNVISDKTNFNLTDKEGNELAQNRKYELVGSSLKINYKGLEQGLHTIKVVFENDKKVSVTKIITLNFVNYDFEYKITTAKKGEIYQAEEVLYNLEINNKNINAGDYEIKFTSYDEADPNLEKSVITFNSQKVELNKWYKISNLSNSEITLKSFYSGEKSLSYSIRNKNIVRNLTLQQTINKRGIVVTTSDVSKTNISKIGEQFKLKALLNKTPNKLSNKIYYKTFITISPEAPDEGITTTNNEYKEYSLTDEGYFEIPLEAKKGGVYKYNIQFKDEWGNESLIVTKNITVDNKDFNIKVTQNYNTNEIYQGRELVNLIKIEQLQNVTNENYHIRFISFEDKDVSLSKSKIIFKHNDINPSEEELVMNEWKSLSEEDLLKGFFIKLKSFYTGVKKVKFEIKNSVSTKQYEFEINVKPYVYRLEVSEEQYSKEGNPNYYNYKVNIYSNIENNNKLEYRVVNSEYSSEWQKGSTKEIIRFYKKRPKNLTFYPNQNIITDYVKIEIKDEFENIVEINKKFDWENPFKINSANLKEVYVKKTSFYDYNNKQRYSGEVSSFVLQINGNGENEKAVESVSIIIGDGEPIASEYYTEHTNAYNVKQNTPISTKNFSKQIVINQSMKRDFDKFKRGYVNYKIMIRTYNWHKGEDASQIIFTGDAPLIIHN